MAKVDQKQRCKIKGEIIMSEKIKFKLKIIQKSKMVILYLINFHSLLVTLYNS